MCRRPPRALPTTAMHAPWHCRQPAAHQSGQSGLLVLPFARHVLTLVFIYSVWLGPTKQPRPANVISGL